MAIRLLLVDDHEIVRIGLRALLSKEADIDIVGEACDGAEALLSVRQTAPDVVLLDVRMPRVDGLACLAKLRAEFANLPVLLLSAYDNPTYQARAVALGAVGYLDKASPAAEIVTGVRRVAGGESLWSADALRRVSGAMATPRMPLELEAPLTRREHDVLTQLANGLSNKEIAQALSISYETVKEHVQHILRKVGVSDRTQAAVWAVRKGLA